MRIVIDSSRRNQSQTDSNGTGSPVSRSGNVNSPVSGPSDRHSTQDRDSATASQEIDLYDENIVHDFSCAKEPDLLDDCLMEMGSDVTDRKRSPATSESLNERSAPATPMVSEFYGQAGQRWIYIGNLTWWTSDEDIEDALRSISVFDLVEVRIADNKPNGMSKGYCEVSVQSEKSVNEIQTRLGKIHDRVPLVLPKTRDSFAHMESLATVSGSPFCNTPINRGRSDLFNRPPSAFVRPVPTAIASCPVADQNSPAMVSGHPSQNSDAYNNGMPSQVSRGYAPRPYPGSFYGSYQPRQLMYRPRYGQNQYYSKYSREYFRGGSRNPPPGNPPYPSWRPQYNQPMYPGSFSHRAPLLHTPPGPGHAPFPPPMDSLPIGNVYNSHSPLRDMRERHSPSRTPPPSDPKITEAYEDLMARNRIVSSSAIERAVKDAGCGEFASAIETLVTAISLLKQSQVASDDRCKILITSLQDTLHGVESRSYGGSRCRSRSRSRSAIAARRHSASSQSYRYFHDTHGYEIHTSRSRAHERHSGSYSHSHSHSRRRSRTMSPSKSKTVSRNFTSEHDS